MPILHPASVEGADLRGVWYIFFGTALFIAAIVYGLIFFSVAMWRRRRGDERPAPQFHTNPGLEITGVVVPLIIVIGLFYITYIREGVVDFLRPNPYAVVDVKAYRWAWEFEYPGHNIAINGNPNMQTTPSLILPLGKMTQINLYSSDVVHSFWVPEFLFKRDATPGNTQHFDVTPTRLGQFNGVCAEYCGLDHALMRFNVRVVPAAAFERWLASGGVAAI
jgi:cytochrome c oxidase subunit 2